MSRFKNISSWFLSFVTCLIKWISNFSWIENKSFIVIQGASASRWRYSARCLRVLDFSALNEGPIVQTGPKEKIKASKYSWALWDKNASSLKYFTGKRVEPPSTALLTNVGVVTSIQSFSTNQLRNFSRTVALIFAIVIIFLVRRVKCL